MWGSFSLYLQAYNTQPNEGLKEESVVTLKCSFQSVVEKAPVSVYR